MAESKEHVIRVSAEDLAAVESAPPAQISTQPTSGAAAGMARSYGNINLTAKENEPAIAEEKGSFLLQGWFYLGAAGLLGAIAGWGVCEPAFVDGEAPRWGNYVLLPAVTTMMLICFAVAESVVERSIKKAVKRLAAVVPLGIVLGFVFDGAANIVYGVGLQLMLSIGVESWRNPGWWVARAVAWAAFGVASGLIYGLIGKSSKKTKYGVIGGAIGAFVGGLVFDPIALFMPTGVQSRAVGLALLGLAAGAAMGFVESALKDRWLYVSGGPLAGKQFVLYKSKTTIGSDQGSDIYLFKDPSIAPLHATVEVRGSQATFRAHAQAFVSGVPTQNHVLLSGELIQIGRYSFRYNERHR